MLQARLLLTNLVGAQNATYKGSIALALGCIHRRYLFSFSDLLKLHLEVLYKRQVAQDT